MISQHTNEIQIFLAPGDFFSLMIMMGRGQPGREVRVVPHPLPQKRSVLFFSPGGPASGLGSVSASSSHSLLLALLAGPSCAPLHPLVSFAACCCVLSRPPRAVVPFRASCAVLTLGLPPCCWRCSTLSGLFSCPVSGVFGAFCLLRLFACAGRTVVFLADFPGGLWVLVSCAARLGSSGAFPVLPQCPPGPSVRPVPGLRCAVVLRSVAVRALPWPPCLLFRVRSPWLLGRSWVLFRTVSVGLAFCFAVPLGAHDV